MCHAGPLPLAWSNMSRLTTITAFSNNFTGELMYGAPPVFSTGRNSCESPCTAMLSLGKAAAVLALLLSGAWQQLLPLCRHPPGGLA